MTRKIATISGEYFHIYNRGVDKRVTFLDEEDFLRFQYLLYLSNSATTVKLFEHTRKELRLSKTQIFTKERSDPLVHIHAYCLMDNHFHLLAKGLSEKGISLFMQKVMTGYTMYFNKKYERTGTLFQGTYKSSHIDNEPYLLYMFSYTHANSFSVVTTDGRISIRDSDKVLNYQYSSILEYREIERPENSIVNTSFFSEMLAPLTDESLKKYIEAWLTYHSTDLS